MLRIRYLLVPKTPHTTIGAYVMYTGKHGRNSYRIQFCVGLTYQSKGERQQNPLGPPYMIVTTMGLSKRFI